MNSLRDLISLCAQEAEYDYLGGRDLDEVVRKIGSHAEVIRYESHGRLLGFISFYCNAPDRKAAFINMLCVAPEARRRGMARRLVRWSLESARGAGFAEMQLEVFGGNGAALPLYEQFGFRRQRKIGTSNWLMSVSL